MTEVTKHSENSIMWSSLRLLRNLVWLKSFYYFSTQDLNHFECLDIAVVISLPLNRSVFKNCRNVFLLRYFAISKVQNITSLSLVSNGFLLLTEVEFYRSFPWPNHFKVRVHLCGCDGCDVSHSIGVSFCEVIPSRCFRGNPFQVSNLKVVLQ